MSENDKSVDPNKSERPSVAEEFVSIGRIWAHYGIRAGTTALENTVDTLFKVAEILGAPKAK